MSEYSFPFKSQNGDRLYKAEGWRNAMRPLYTQGVFPIDPQLQVTAGTGMEVSISAGFAFLDGVVYRNDAATTKMIDAADGVLNRKDRVCIRINEENREATIVILKGTPSAVAATPSIVRDQDYYDICLAVINIPAGITSIASTHITDTRLDNDVCGIAAPFAVPDTSGWYDNWNDEYTAWLEGKHSAFSSWMAGEQEDFAAWFETLTDALSTEQATNLYNLIVAAEAHTDEQAFTTYVHSKTGTNHELTLQSGEDNIKFVATSDYEQGDTFTVNGNAYTAKMPDGNDLSDGFFKTGAVVIGFINNATIYFVGGAAMKTQVIITLAASDGGSLTGQIVTVTNAEDDSEIEEFTYAGQAHTVLVPVAAQYKVSVNAKTGYVTPDEVQYTALANTPRSITLTYQYGTRYGFKREKNNSSPASRITYILDAVGKTPMTMNLLTGAANYGSWESFINSVAVPMMKGYDDQDDYELSRSDQTKKSDGVTASDVANDAYAGNAVVKFTDAFKWVKRYEDASYEYVIFANVQFDSSYHAYAHTNGDGVIKDAFYWGMFKGYNASSKLRSIAGKAVMVSQTRATEIQYAQANGSGYYTIYKSGHDYIDDLLTLISKSDDSQGVFGAGRSKSNNTAAVNTGTLKDKPGFYGKSDETTDVKVFWIEGYWGNVWEGMAGLILDGTNGIKTRMTPPYNVTGAGYTATGIVPSGTSGGYINTESVTDASGFVPKTANGSASTYTPDGLWFNTSQVDYALVGGSWPRAALCGSRCVDLSALASAAGASVGSRLSYIPV